jgi:hypothetical protein
VIEARDLLADSKYPGYRRLLEEKREAYEKELLRPFCDPRRMDYLAGAISALDFALGRPDVMKDTLPAESETP